MSARPYFYTVKPGDTLSRIGKRFGVPWKQLAEHNGIDPPRYLIRVGAELLIPGVMADAPTPPEGMKPPFIWVLGEEDDTEHAWARRGLPIFLIIHDPVAASPEGLLGYLRRNDRSVSYEDVIVPGSPPKVHTLADAGEWVGHAGFGTATDAVSGRRYGLAAGSNLNPVSRSICIYKHKLDEGPFPEPLYTAAVALAAERARQFAIDPRNILSHGEVDPGRRRDPRGIRMDAFRQHVADELARLAAA